MSISTLAQTQQTTQSLLQLQTQGNTLEQQISSGLVSESYAGVAPQAGQIVSLNAQVSQQQSYINTINTVGTTLQTMSLATSTMATLVQQFAGTLSSDAYNQTGDTIQTQAQSLLTQIGSYINTSDGEGYVFSGSASTTAPYDPSGLPNPGNLTTNVASAPPNGYYAGNDNVAQAQVNNQLTVQYGITGDNPAFEQVVQVLNYLANTPPLSSSDATDVANVNQATQMLTTAAGQLQQLTANIGLQQSQLNSELTAHQSSLTLAQGSLGDIENVNSATAITQLDTLQTQIEASYQTVNILQNLSLANYLK